MRPGGVVRRFLRGALLALHVLEWTPAWRAPRELRDGLRRLRRRDGQAAVELLAAVPVLVVAAFLAWQVAAAGWAAVRAEEAVRAAGLHASESGGTAHLVTVTSRVAVPGPLASGLHASARAVVRVP